VTEGLTEHVAVGVIARRRIPELDRLVAELQLLEGPPREIIVGVETPGAIDVSETRDENGVRWLALPARRGLGYNRNRVLDAVNCDIMFGADDDCMPEPGWMTRLLAALEDPHVDGAVGSIRIPPAGFLGDSISALGFPAGGSAGYETMFPVADDGSTTNISVGNSALRVKTVRELGGFDEAMTLGGEDTELAARFEAAGKRVVFVSSATIVHPARTSLGEFMRWSFVRGRAKAQIARKVTAVGGLVSNRLASFGRILRQNARDPKLVLIVPLLVLNVALQQIGFLAEMVSPTRPPGDEQPG